MFAYPNTMVMDAFYFAQESHLGQVRKYTGEPYITHPVRVARLVSEVTDDPVMIAGALLHDTVEDCDVSIATITARFGEQVAKIVGELTEPSLPGESRHVRVTAALKHLSFAGPKAQTIKLSDIIDNVSSVAEHDEKFAKIYVPEKARALVHLKDGNNELLIRAKVLIASLLLKL